MGCLEKRHPRSTNIAQMIFCGEQHSGDDDTPSTLVHQGSLRRCSPSKGIRALAIGALVTWLQNARAVNVHVIVDVFSQLLKHRLDVSDFAARTFLHCTWEKRRLLGSEGSLAPEPRQLHVDDLRHGESGIRRMNSAYCSSGERNRWRN